MKILRLSIIFICSGIGSILSTIVETEYRIWLMRYGGICKAGSSCGGYPIVNPFWIYLGIALIVGGGYFVLVDIKNKKKEAKK